MTDARSLPWRERFQACVSYLGGQLLLLDSYVFVVLSLLLLALLYPVHSWMNPPFGFGWVVVTFLVFVAWLAGRLVTWVAQKHVDFVEGPNWHGEL